MNEAVLLAVVEVPEDKKVRCQAPGCSHSIFRRVHVVLEDSGIHVYGSTCFEKRFDGLPVASSTPRYTSSGGRNLTEEERLLLLENTEELIQRLEAEYQDELARKHAAQSAVEPPSQLSPSIPQASTLSSSANVRSQPMLITSAPSEIEEKAKEIVREKHRVDPALPGWRGLVLFEIWRILGTKSGYREGE